MCAAHFKDCCFSESNDASPCIFPFPQPICAPRDHGAVGEKWITNEKLPLWNERKTHCLNFLVFQVLSDLSQMRRRNENMKLFPNMNLNQPMAMLLTLNHSSQLFRDLELCFLSAYHHPVSFSHPPATFREWKHLMCKETKCFVLLTWKIALWWLLFVYAIAYQGQFFLLTLWENKKTKTTFKF